MKKVCQRVREQIPELVSGALGPEKAGELRQHIGACPTCSEYLRCLKADDKQLRDYVEGMQSTLARLEDSVIEALGKEPSRERISLVSIWKTLRKSSIAKIAAAAVIIIVALIGVEVLIGPHEQPAQKVAEDGRIPAGPPSTVAKHVKPEDEYGAYPVDAEVRVREDESLILAGEPESRVVRVEEMIAAGDIEGLAAMLDGGEVESRMMAAYYLAIIGEPRGTAVLKELLPVYIAGDPNRITVLAKFAQGLSVDRKEVSERWTAERLGDHKDKGAQRLEGKDVLVRLYRDWRTKPAVFETVSVQVVEGSVNFDSIKFGPNEVGETVVAVFGEDQTDVNVAEAVGDSIYAVSYKKGTNLPLPCADLGRHKEATLIFNDATPGPEIMLGAGRRIPSGEPMVEAVVEIFVQAYDGPRIQVGKYVLDASGGLNVPSAIGSLNQFVFIVSHPQYGMAQVDWYPQGGTNVVSVPLVREDSSARERAIWGTIVDPEDNPVAGAVVECSNVRTLGEGLIIALDGSCKVVSDANGFFTCYMPNERLRDDRGLLIPPKSRYHVKIEAPKELELLPYVGGIMNGQETTVVMERSDYFHTFVFEDRTGPITNTERLKTINLVIDQEVGGRLNFGYDDWKDGGVFPLGTYQAAMDYSRGARFEPLEVIEDSPQELVFRLSESIVYHGRVIHGLTGEPMEGVFVISMYNAEWSNFSRITPEQWELLHELPADPCISDEALEPVKEIYGFSRVVRTDANGFFEISVGPLDGLYALVFFEEDYLAIMHQEYALKSDATERTEVREVKLYPAAKVMVEARVEPNESKGTGELVVRFDPASRTGTAGVNVSIWPRWVINEENNPAWAKEFLATDDRSGRSFTHDHLLKQNAIQTVHVPAGLNVRLKLDTPYDDRWCPITVDEIINLAQGETLDLGRVSFQPAIRVSVKVVSSAGEPIEGVPVRKRVGDGGWDVPHNSDEKGVCRFNLCPYTEGEFGVHYEGEGDLDLRETLPYEIAGPNDANSVYTFQISDEMLDHLSK